MDEHFRAFSFVDRITLIDAGSRVRGFYDIPSNLPDFPASLATEAVGQLAAWASMSKLDFKVRPLAGIAGAIEFSNVPSRASAGIMRRLSP
jgi:hypothetical protein